jgi:hypothetical protein
MLGILSLTLVLLASPAFAAQNVGNTSQKGSLLIFPYISARPDTGEGLYNDGIYTLVHISNAGPSNANLQCMWMNEKKVVRNFTLTITKKGSVLIDAKTGVAEGGQLGSGSPFQVNAFPVGVFGNFDGFEFEGQEGNGTPQSFEGELICFAVDGGGDTQVAYNHLKGEATIVRGGDDDQVAAFSYTAWAFTARAPFVGTPGVLNLSGLAGGYDACPNHLIVNLHPKGSELEDRSAVGNDIEVEFGTTKLGISACTQDIRDVGTRSEYNVTLLSLLVWDAYEHKNSGAFECADSTWLFKLSDRDVDVGGDFFKYDHLGTKTALVKVVPTADATCETEPNYTAIAPGIVGVAATEVELEDLEEEEGDDLIGTNLVGQGAVAGTIIYSTAGGDPEGN